MIRIAICMTVMLGLTGCSPTSQIRIPLVDPSMAVDARALAGVYTLKQQDGDIGYLHVDSATKEYPANFLRLTWVSGNAPEGPGAITWPVYASTINQTYIIHIPLPEDLDHVQFEASSEFWSKSWERTKVTGYVLFQARLTNTGLEISRMNEEFWASAIASGKLQGTVTSHDLPKMRKSVDVTSGRNELLQFMETHLNEAFEERPTKLQRLAIAP